VADPSSLREPPSGDKGSDETIALSGLAQADSWRAR
jgi:hypothetical protein